MEEEFIKEVKEKLKRSNKLIMYFDIYDLKRLVKIIEALESRNKCNMKYIKELENQHKQDCNIINIYIGGNK